jgi:long-chain fatty acid transport protein
LRITRITLLLTLVSLISVSAFGAGFSIFEQGAKASGMAGAFAATADDPSAVFYNPAGIAQQRELSVLAGATFINFSNEFIGDPNSEMTSGTTGEYNRHTFVPPNAYAVVPIGDNLSVGIGTFALFGLRTDWADPWVGRFVSRDADLKSVSVNPVIAWRTSNDKFAIGGGLEYRRARVILNANRGALSPFTGRIVDVANTRLVSDYGDGMGWNLGVLLKPTPRLRLAATYRADMDIDLEGDAEITQISTGNPQFDAIIKSQLPPNQKIETTFPFPAVSSFAVAFSPTENWDLEFDVTHMTWSTFGALKVDFLTTPAAGFTREQNWHDSSAYRLGVNHAATPEWDVRLGLVYDENPQPTEHVSPLLPDADRIGATIGTGWHRGHLIADWSLMVLHFKDRSTEGMEADDFNGTYETDALLWSVNFGYRF